MNCTKYKTCNIFTAITSSLFPSMGGSRGGQGVRTPLKNHKNIGCLSNTGPDPLKNHKATKLAFNVGPSSFQWRFAGGPIMAHFIAVFVSSTSLTT